jgi:NADH dehydrogenase FAD-containing subunit
LTFALVGAGTVGVEMAGTLAENGAHGFGARLPAYPSQIRPDSSV